MERKPVLVGLKNGRVIALSIDISNEERLSFIENGCDSVILMPENSDVPDFKSVYEIKFVDKATPEGFVLVPVKEIKTWFLDESENIYREDPDWLCDIPIGEVVEVEHRVSYELEQDPVFAAIQWDEINGDVGNYETFDTKEEAEKVAAHCKAMIEAQEQKKWK